MIDAKQFAISDTGERNMRAMRVHELSENVDVLRMDEVKLPAPGPGEVRLRLKACSVNFPDILMVQGKYQFKPDLPFSPGMEGAGIVAEVGYGVTRLKPGDRVVAGLRVGGFAEEVNVPELACRPIPGSMDFAAAAAYPAAYLTAYVALVCRGHLQKGETLLVHGSTGGVGLAAVEMGKLLGATVIATSASDEKLKIVKERGADHVINYRADRFEGVVRKLTRKKGVDVVFEHVGADTWAGSMLCLKRGGRLVTCGSTSGVSTSMNLMQLFQQQLKIFGSFGCRMENMADAMQKMAAGHVAPVIDTEVGFDGIATALARMEGRDVFGKIILRVA
jgi:NADPH:quinone reductase-like Zn-dependent oxidoreductase